MISYSRLAERLQSYMVYKYMCKLTLFGYFGHLHLNKREGSLLWYSCGTDHCLGHQYIKLNMHYVNDDIY